MLYSAANEQRFNLEKIDARNRMARATRDGKNISKEVETLIELLLSIIERMALVLLKNRLTTTPVSVDLASSNQGRNGNRNKD